MIISEQANRDGYGYVASRAPANDAPIAEFTRRSAEGRWEFTLDDGRVVAVPDDETIYGTKDEARGAAAERYARRGRP
jgi:hypothetical protein